MALREHKTIEAISNLRQKYPYAAALLSYVAVERVLKSHLLEERKNKRYAHVQTPDKKVLGSKYRKKPLRDLTKIPDSQFIGRVLCRLTLGDIEQMLQVSPNRRAAADRNEVMHSNLYLRQEAALSDARRQQKNVRRLKRALMHLRRAVRLAGGRLVEGDGRLQLQPNPAVEQTAGSHSLAAAAHRERSAATRATR